MRVFVNQKMDLTARNTTISLTSTQSRPLKSMSGFSAIHKSDKRKRSASELANIATTEINHVVDEVYQQARHQFSLKRKQLAVAHPSPEIQSIHTPHFEFEISVGPDEASVDTILFHRRFSCFSNLNLLVSSELQGITADHQWNICREFDRPLIVEQLIDALEDLEIESLDLEFPRSFEWVQLRFGEIPDVSTYVRADRAEFSIKGNSGPRELVAAYQNVSEILMEHAPNPQSPEPVAYLYWPE